MDLTERVKATILYYVRPRLLGKDFEIDCLIRDNSRITSRCLFSSLIFANNVQTIELFVAQSRPKLDRQEFRSLCNKAIALKRYRIAKCLWNRCEHDHFQTCETLCKVLHQADTEDDLWPFVLDMVDQYKSKNGDYTTLITNSVITFSERQPTKLAMSISKLLRCFDWNTVRGTTLLNRQVMSEICQKEDIDALEFIRLNQVSYSWPYNVSLPRGSQTSKAFLNKAFELVPNLFDTLTHKARISLLQMGAEDVEFGRRLCDPAKTTITNEFWNNCNVPTVTQSILKIYPQLAFGTINFPSIFSHNFDSLTNLTTFLDQMLPRVTNRQVCLSEFYSPFLKPPAYKDLWLETRRTFVQHLNRHSFQINALPDLALAWCAQTNDVDYFDCLVDQVILEVDGVSPFLQIAIAWGNIEIIKKLVRSGVTCVDYWCIYTAHKVFGDIPDCLHHLYRWP